jgi:hypothetical protein
MEPNLMGAPCAKTISKGIVAPSAVRPADPVPAKNRRREKLMVILLKLSSLLLGWENKN